MQKRKIIMDCDPGHDDAIAILVANKIPSLEILGITVVSGNSSLDLTVKNTLKTVHHLGMNVKVYPGMDRPMIRSRFLSTDSLGNVHGETGLDGPVFADVELHPEHTHAVYFIINTLRNSAEKITLCCSGPLTNIGMALRLAPDIVDKIDEIVTMGGSYGTGNVTASAEFNILADPEAAHIVYTSGVKVTMIGLDVTRQSLAYSERVDKIRALNNVGSKFFVDLIEFFTESQRQVFGWVAPPIHDVVNIAYLADPSVIQFIDCAVWIELGQGPCYGRTVCDTLKTRKDPHTTQVADILDKDKFWNILTTAIAQY